MPEGHTVHRIARQFRADFIGHAVAVSSPQGRFAAGAALLDGGTVSGASALGKHLFLDVATDGGPRHLHVHLGLYGAWDFHGRISPISGDSLVPTSMGAPRRAVRMGEGENPLPDDAVDPVFPPPPVGAVRVRILTEHSVADLRGPITCEVLTADEVHAIVLKAGPDPQLDATEEAERRFVDRVTSRGVPVGVLLMDQSVVSGIGNVYRAELLHRAELDPHTPGRRVPREVLSAIWRDWAGLLEDGVRTGLMLTREDVDDRGRERGVADPAERHAVYRRTGEPCRRCGTPVATEEMAGRNLYWCPGCQH